MASVYMCRPSQLMGIDDAYTCYCLDELCAVILSRMQNGEKPRFEQKYKSAKAIYDNLGLS